MGPNYINLVMDNNTNQFKNYTSNINNNKSDNGDGERINTETTSKIFKFNNCNWYHDIEDKNMELQKQFYQSHLDVSTRYEEIIQESKSAL